MPFSESMEIFFCKFFCTAQKSIKRRVPAFLIPEQIPLEAVNPLQLDKTQAVTGVDSKIAIQHSDSFSAGNQHHQRGNAFCRCHNIWRKTGFIGIF